MFRTLYAINEYNIHREREGETASLCCTKHTIIQTKKRKDRNKIIENIKQRTKILFIGKCVQNKIKL